MALSGANLPGPLVMPRALGWDSVEAQTWGTKGERGVTGTDS